MNLLKETLKLETKFNFRELKLKKNMTFISKTILKQK